MKSFFLRDMTSYLVLCMVALCAISSGARCPESAPTTSVLSEIMMAPEDGDSVWELTINPSSWIVTFADVPTGTSCSTGSQFGCLYDSLSFCEGLYTPDTTPSENGVVFSLEDKTADDQIFVNNYDEYWGSEIDDNHIYSAYIGEGDGDKKAILATFTPTPDIHHVQVGIGYWGGTDITFYMDAFDRDGNHIKTVSTNEDKTGQIGVTYVTSLELWSSVPIGVIRLRSVAVYSTNTYYNTARWDNLLYEYAPDGPADIDDDGIPDNVDNCPLASNPGQEDLDDDGVGDACDPDIDGDGVLNEDDNCPLVSNSDQEDLDDDGIGDVCDPDIDGDGVLNEDDNCPLASNSDQEDLDDDGIGDVCDPDIDGDGIDNLLDNCPFIPNPNQDDWDGDGVGDACDPDIDGDGVLNDDDQCEFTDMGETVDPLTGCSIWQLVPCEGPLSTSSPWRNHGQYVQALAHVTNEFLAMGLITGEEKGAIMAEGSSSDCGKNRALFQKSCLIVPDRAAARVPVGHCSPCPRGASWQRPRGRVAGRGPRTGIPSPSGT